MVSFFFLIYNSACFYEPSIKKREESNQRKLFCEINHQEKLKAEKSDRLKFSCRFSCGYEAMALPERKDPQPREPLTQFASFLIT